MNRPHPHGASTVPLSWNGLLGRRDLLRVGAVGLAGTLLPLARAGHSGTARSVVVLWIAGGWLGREFAPFPTGGRARNEDFTAGVSEAPEEDFARQALDLAVGTDSGRLDARRSLRERLDDGLRGLESAGMRDTINRQYRG